MAESKLAGKQLPVSRAGLKITTGIVCTVVDGKVIKDDNGDYRWRYDVLMTDGSIIKCYAGRNQIGGLIINVPQEHESEF